MLFWIKWVWFVFLWSVLGPYERIPFKKWKEARRGKIKL